MRAMAHRVIVMKAGRVVEEGDTLDVLHAPSHPPAGAARVVDARTGSGT
jgi:ABC-type microcin C transport system duplicated ATPase subunit YejF